MDLLSITFDHAQQRRQFDRLPAFVAGSELWDTTLSSDAWLEPATNTLILKPAPLYDAWWTTHTGTYAKLTGAALEYLTSGNWKAVDVVASGEANYYLTSTAGEWMRTASALTKNRPVFVSFHNYTAGDQFPALSCGWGSSASTSTGVAIEFYSNGRILVYKSGVVIHEDRVDLAANKLNSYLLLPGRRRELIIINTDTQSSSRVVFDDIAETDTNPTITPAEKFWVLNPSGTTTAQLCPVKFPTSGYGVSVQTSFSEAPEATDTLETWTNDAWAGGAGQTFRLWGNPAYAGTTGGSASLREADGTAFSADGATLICRVRASMTGDGNYTPFVEAAELAYANIFEATDATEEVENAEAFMNSVDLTVPEGSDGATWSTLIYDPENRGIVNLIGMSNRPVKVAIGAITLTDGRGSPGRRNLENSDEATSMAYTIADATVALASYTFPERKSLRGYTLDQALTFVMSQVVPTSMLDIEASTYKLGDSSAADSGDQNPMIEEGESAAEWIERLHERTDREWGFVPTASGVKWISKREATLNATVHVKLYQAIADAIADSVPDDVAQYRSYGDITDDQYEPAANDVRVTGVDPRTGRPLQAFKRDPLASDVTTPPSTRPANWVGERRRAGFIDDQIATQGEVDDMTSDLFDQITAFRPPWQIETSFPINDDGVPLWKTHRVELDGYGIFAVRSLSASFLLEDDETDAGPSRQATYVLTFIEAP